MRHLPVEPPPFFHRGPSPLARLAFFGVISIALLFVDTRYHYLEGIRHAAMAVLYPVQRVVLWPVDEIIGAGRYFIAQHDLIDENAELKRQLVDRSSIAQALPIVREENERLRSLLDVRTRRGWAAVAVEVLYSGRDPFAQKLFIDKGADVAIRPGAAVIDAEGVVGQVTRVFPLMAEVTLVTDKDQAVPVKVQRSGVRSVLYGAGAGRTPELRFISPSADIQIGDLLVTSGLDGTYPAGLAVARVASVERETGQMFARIGCAPLAGVDRSSHLLVLGSAAAAPPRPEEPAETETVKKIGKGKRKGAGSP
jgi:rod shape-determining protein MreC